MITIPDPCHQNWNTMNPADKGRFCHACEKIVVDFTKMETREIIHYFSEGRKACGHIRSHQLWHLDNYVVIRPLKPKRNWKPTGYSILMVISAFLSSCRQERGDLLGEVEIATELSDSAEVNVQTMDSVDYGEACSGLVGEVALPFPGDSLELDTFTTEGDIMIEPGFEPSPDIHNVLVTPEILPEFITGELGFINYLKANIKYPEKAMRDCKEGRAIISFVVLANGTVSDVEIVKDPAPGYGLGEEAARVIKQMQNWKPGYKNGTAIPSKMVVPVKFKMD